MVSTRRHLKYLALPLVLLLLLTACERPLASNDSETAEESAEATIVAESAENESEAGAEAETADEQTSEGDEVQSDDAEADEADEADEAESSDSEAGGGTPETAAEEEAAEEVDSQETDSGAAEETSEDVTTDEAAADEAATEEAGEAEEAAESEDNSGTEGDGSNETAEAAAAAGAATASDEASSEDAAPSSDTVTEEEVATDSTSTLPATHTVAPGENLYRIGLQYGMSWVTLAAYNNLPNANYVRVGQVLQIPGGSAPAPMPPPTNPDEPGYTNYVVQRGDTLNSIGQKFGVSWVEIAEANGIVNPNLIYAGQVLKIPTGQPETPPSLTHTVKPGETLNRISLQYGVHWLAIAQANHIVPPYIIYPGQVLVIPSG